MQEATFKWIDPSRIQKNWELNPRERDAVHIENLAKHMNSDGYDKEFPIIVYNLEGETWELPFAATGYHRLEAAMLKSEEFPHLPLKRVYVEVRDGTIDDLVKTMMLDNFRWDPSVNRKLGKMPNRNEVRAMRYRLLFIPSEFKKGDRMLASEWGCDHKVVGRLRDKLIEEVQGGAFTPPQFVNQTDIVDILKIYESDMFLALDGNKHPRRDRNGNGNQPELPGVPSTDAAKSEALHAEWVSISLKVGKCLQDLDFKHLLSTTLIRRLKAPRETVAWTEDADYEKGIKDAQVWLAEFSDWRASAEANGSIDGEMALMLEELSLINEVLGIYKPLIGSHFHEEMLSTDGIDAKTALQSIGSADWELQDRSVRMECLRDLQKVFAHVCRFEEEARAAKAEVDRQAQEEALIGKARETFKASKASVSKAWEDSGIQCHLLGDVDEEAVVSIAAKAFDCDFGMLFEIFSITWSDRLSNLSIKELNQWREKLDEIRVALQQKGECFSHLFSQPDACLKEIKTELHKQNTLDYLDDAALKDTYKVDGETLAGLKDQANADGCKWIEEQHARYIQEAFDIYLTEYAEHDWEEFWKAAAEEDSRLSLEVFDGTREKGDILDYRVLYNELNGIKRFKQHLKEKRGIVEKFLVKPELDALKADLKVNHWDHEHSWDDIPPSGINHLAEKYHCTAENVREAMRDIETDAMKQIKIDHSNAQLGVQAAFFDNNLHNLMEVPADDMIAKNGRLKDFFGMVIKAKRLRSNLYSEDFFYLDAETGSKDRDLTYHEIAGEVHRLSVVADEVRRAEDWVMALFAKTSAADASKADTQHYSLESVTITFMDADQNIQDPLRFQVIASRQLDERPMIELPDALRAELLKLVNNENPN